MLNYEIGPQVRAIVYADLLKPEKVRGLGHEQGCKSNKNGDFMGFITNNMGVYEDIVYSSIEAIPNWIREHED